MHLGHHTQADGRWRLYAFADAGETPTLAAWAEWLATSPQSPVVTYTPEGHEVDSLFDVKLVSQRSHEEVDLLAAPEIFRPRTGPFSLINYEKIYAADPEDDIFTARGVDRSGCVVVVRPD